MTAHFSLLNLVANLEENTLEHIQIHFDMHPILNMLKGGDRRSIGRSNEAVALVLDKPELFDVLLSGIALDDPLVRMRCADAAEKISVLHPEYLLPYKRKLIEDYSRIEQKEVRWHIAAMLARLPLTAKEQTRVIEILLSYTNDRSSIVKTLAMQGWPTSPCAMKP